MVEIAPEEAIFLTLLLVCVPIQMWLQNQHIQGTTLDSRDGKLFAIIRDFQK